MELVFMWSLGILLCGVVLSVVIIREGHVGVTLLFGKYHRILKPGLHFRIPLVETLHKKITLQNRSIELEFQAITRDQANVNFKTLILYAVKSDSEETIKNAAFRFIDDRSFMQSLVRSVEGAVRSFVATKYQNEILSFRKEIVHDVNSHIEEELNTWGFHLISLQINDISFDEAILRSMAQVVATHNMKCAAENEAQAQYISKVRLAEAEALSRKLIADADKKSEELRGEGNAMFHQKVASGLSEAAKTINGNPGEGAFMLFTMWLDTMKSIAATSQGNLLSFDGSNDGFEKTLKQMSLFTNGSMGFLKLDEKSAKDRLNSEVTNA